MFRRISATVIGVMLIFVMTVSAFAADTVTKEMTASDFSANINLSVNKTSLSLGDTLTLRLWVENIEGADDAYRQYYRTTLFSDTSFGDILDIDSVVVPDKFYTSMEPFQNLTYVDYYANDESVHVSDFEITVNCTIKEDIEPQSITLTPRFFVMPPPNHAVTQFDSITIEITDSSTEPEETQNLTYAITPIASDSEKYVGETFTVSAIVSADQADAAVAAVDAVLNYDPELVMPINVVMNTFENGEVSYDQGQGRIYTYGNSHIVGENGIAVATYTFEAIKSGNAEFSISGGAIIGISGSNTEIIADTSTKAYVQISEVPDTISVIANDTFMGAPTGLQLLKYTAKELPDGESKYIYNDSTELYYAGTNEEGKHIFLGFVSSNFTNDTVSIASVTTGGGIYTSVAYDGDVNQNSAVNAIDSLIAYDLAGSNETYLADSDFSLLSALARLNADVNKDGRIDAADARAIMYKSLGINPPAEESSSNSVDNSAA